MSKPYVFYVTGITCDSCIAGIQNNLTNIKTLNFQSINYDKFATDPKLVKIFLNESDSISAEQQQIKWEQLKECIEEVGFSCLNTPDEAVLKPTQTKSETLEHEQTSSSNDNKLKQVLNRVKKIISSRWFLGGLGCITGMAMLIATLATGGLPLAALIPLGILSTLVTLALGYNSYKHAWKALIKTRSANMDTLFSISTLTVIGVSIASFFVPWLPMMFEAGLLIYGFRHLGLAIEDTIKKKINPGKFQDRVPKTVTLLQENNQSEVDLQLVKPDDRLLIKPGDLIPLDGLCEESALIYDTIITGKTLPRQFAAHEKILAGMRLSEGMPPLIIRVQNPAQNSYLSCLDASIEKSLEEKTPLELKTQKLLTYFIPTVLALAIITGILIGIFFTPALAILCAISILVSACPCTLGLIVPLSVKTGIHKAAEHGVQFKNPKSLQEAEQIDTLVFDLNGTLTTGVPRVKHCKIATHSRITIEEFQILCAALEASSVHPAGKSIHQFCNPKGNKILPSIESIKNYHSGLSAQIEQKEYTIGSLSLMQQLNISTEAFADNDKLSAGDSLVYVAEEKRIIGFFVLTDPLRKDAVQTIKTLKGMGKNIHLCTGADEETALRYANELGIEEVYSNAVATQLEKKDRSKSAYIKQLQNAGCTVAMIGDAANDVEAIAASNFGIAILSQNSDELTQQHAGAVIQNDALLTIASAFEISRKTVAHIKYSLLFNLGFNLSIVLIPAILAVTVGFVLNPAIGVAIMGLQLCLLLLYVYYFKQQPIQHLKEQPGTIEQPVNEEQAALTDELTPQQSLELNYQIQTPGSWGSSFFKEPHQNDSNQNEEIATLYPIG